MRRFLVKISILLMFISGILQHQLFELSWESFRVIEMLHVVFSVAIFLFLLNGFMYKHIRYYYFKKGVKSLDGWLFFASIVVVALSGVYLLFVGNRGGDEAGIISYVFHLYGSLALVLLFFVHIVKHSYFKSVATAIVVIALFIPQDSYADFSKFTRLGATSSKDAYHSEDFTNSTRCKSCHGDIFKQWANSNHKHMVGSNPYYMLMETLAGEDMGEDFRKWCMGCHNPSGVLVGLDKTTHLMQGNIVENEIYDSEAKLLQDSFHARNNLRIEEGVSCVLCHQIDEVSSKGNASFRVNLDRKKYFFEDSNFMAGKFLSDRLINANPKVHKQSYSKEFYKDSKYCASCHDEQHPFNGIDVVSTYKEWEKSSYNNPSDKTKHKSCIDCHMSSATAEGIKPQSGTSTDGGVFKKDLKTHYFAGSNYFLAGLKDATTKEQIINLLKTSASLDVDINGSTLNVGVTNSGAGHHLPTGVADFRELWLDVELRDASGNVVLSSGKLDKNNELQEGSRVFQKVFGDENNKRVGLYFWRYKTMLKDTRIPAKQRRVESFELPKDLHYPLSVDVKLKFRIYPQWVSSAVMRLYPTMPNPDIIELNSISKKF